MLFRSPIGLLLYVVQFSADPVKMADHAIKILVEKDSPDFTREEYIAGIEYGLKSGEPLSSLHPDCMIPEEKVREFLTAVVEKLRK